MTHSSRFVTSANRGPGNRGGRDTARAVLWPLLVLALVLPAAEPALGQDVEALGRIHGTTPPAGYFERIAQDPTAFQFQRGWRSSDQLRENADTGRDLFGSPVGAAAQGSGGVPYTAGPAGVLGRRVGAVEGTFRVPLLLGSFTGAISDPAFSVDEVRAQFFDGPNPYGTITDYYREVSGGRVELLATAFDWIEGGLTETEVAGGSSGLGNSARVGEFIIDLLVQLDDGSVDWGQFDNDGPDGVPNSGDDDGFVDILAVMHANRGGECGGFNAGSRVWSHRWSLGRAFDVFVTSTPSNSTESDSEHIRIDDYTIQPLLGCDALAINTIGVFTHELGHGFGLPDLYGVNSAHAGIGEWGLMGSGSWGCKGTNPGSPCHMGAWSKEILGWADIVDLPGGTAATDWDLEPVETGGPILRVGTLDGSGNYFLLENRQPIGFDKDLHKPGLLIWRVDPAVVEGRWASNRVNSNAASQGVSVVQADGENDLERSGGGRGDGGDIFPGNSDNYAFHTTTSPAAVNGLGEATGLTITDIDLQVPLVSFRMTNRFTVLTVRQEGPDDLNAFLRFGDQTLDLGPDGVVEVEAAPFETVTMDAVSAPGAEDGVRVGFSGWEDGSGRLREIAVPLHDTTLVAHFAGEEVRLEVSLDSPAQGIVPGAVEFSPTSPDNWFSRGQEVVARAVPGTGFAFLDWGGELKGEANPLSLTLDEPRALAAEFEVTFDFSEVPEDGVEVEAAVPTQLVLQVENAVDPVHWTLDSGTLPEGMFLDPLGRVRGIAMEVGQFLPVIRATDGQGLSITTPLSITVIEPVIGAEALAGPFLLTGQTPTPDQLTFLDRSGNGSGSYDLGDLRAFVQRNPDLPLTADLPEPVLEFLNLGPVGGAR